MRREDRARTNSDALITDFGEYVSYFESEEAFPGPSVYFHNRALDRRRNFADAASLLCDIPFMEYLYAVLPAWGCCEWESSQPRLLNFES